MTSNAPTPTQGTTASRAYAQQALDALDVTRDALNDGDPAGIDIGLRMADVYAPPCAGGRHRRDRRGAPHPHLQRAAGPSAGGMSTERGSLDVSGGVRHSQRRAGGQCPRDRPTETAGR